MTKICQEKEEKKQKLISLMNTDTQILSISKLNPAIS